MRERVGMKVVKALKRNDDGVSHAAIDMLGALMQVRNLIIYQKVRGSKKGKNTRNILCYYEAGTTLKSLSPNKTP